MRNIIIIVLVVFFQFSCSRQYDDQSLMKEVSETQVRTEDSDHYLNYNQICNKAVNYFDKHDTLSVKSKGREISDINVITRKVEARTYSFNDPDTIMYIINFNDNLGFVVLASDDRIPCLAFAEDGHFDITKKEIQPYIEQASNFVQRQKQTFSDHFVTIDSLLPKPFPDAQYLGLVTLVQSPSKLVKEVKPLLKTKWNQNDPYNKYAPVVTNPLNGYGGKAPAGCVAIAVSQIMAYHGHPNRTSSIHGSSIDWSKINVKRTIYELGILEKDKLAQFIYDVGVLVKTKYNNDGSSSNISNAYDGFKAWGYHADRISDFSDDIVKGSLENLRPVYVRGNSTESGHAWVMDGFKIYSEKVLTYRRWKTSRYPEEYMELVHQGTAEHIYYSWNLGWGKLNSGYYLSGTWDYSEPATIKSTGPSDYSEGVKVITNIYY